MKYLEIIFKHVRMELLFRPAEGYFCDRPFIQELDHQEAKEGLCGDPDLLPEHLSSSEE